VFVAIIMTGMGVGFFGDVLTISQMIGVLLVFVGIATLSFSKLHALSGTALFLMALAGAFYSPFYLTQKWVLSHGETFFSTFFWMILGREFFAITLSSLLPTSRRQILASLPYRSLRFYLFNFVSITLFLFAMYSISRAYAVGSATYVSILGNVQPFVVIAVAWVFTMFAPDLAPRELLTARSLRVKVLSFSLVFLGLALLGVSQ
jgi:drug/metabolite transporter (DMT)-like permease